MSEEPGAHRGARRPGSQLLTGELSKVLVAVLTAVSSALPIYFGTAKWEPLAIWALGIVIIYLVPNARPPR